MLVLYRGKRFTFQIPYKIHIHEFSDKNKYFSKNLLTNLVKTYYNNFCRKASQLYADVAELADAQDLKSCG